MKKYFLLLLLPFISIDLSYSQCAIDTGITQISISPPGDSLPCIVRDSSYDQTLQIRIGASIDTTYSGIPISLKIHWVHVLRLEGLPSGINWSLIPTSDTLPGGTSGCLTLSGTTDTAGTYGIHAFVDAYVHIPRIPYYFPNGKDTVFHNLDLTKLGEPYSLFVINEGDSCPPKTISGINNLNKEQSLSFTISPNPGNGIFQLKLNSAEKLNGELVLTDITGREVFIQQVNATYTFQTALDLTTFSKGPYLLQLRTINGVISKKLVLQ